MYVLCMQGVREELCFVSLQYIKKHAILIIIIIIIIIFNII